MLAKAAGTRKHRAQYAFIILLRVSRTPTTTGLGYHAASKNSYIQALIRNQRMNKTLDTRRQPFGWVEAIWAIVAARRWWQEDNRLRQV